MFTYKAQIKRIIDADSWVLEWIDLGFGIKKHNVVVRAYGIDTEESRVKCATTKYYGVLAKEYVKSCLKPGQQVHVKAYKDSTGKFGRLLASVYDKGLSKASINARLVRNHLAVEYYGQSKSEVKAAHLLNRKVIDSVS